MRVTVQPAIATCWVLFLVLVVIVFIVVAFSKQNDTWMQVPPVPIGWYPEFRRLSCFRYYNRSSGSICSDSTRSTERVFAIWNYTLTRAYPPGRGPTVLRGLRTTGAAKAYYTIIAEVPVTCTMPDHSDCYLTNRSAGHSLIKIYTGSQTSIIAYLGIPYAKPPVGELRFMAPERHEGWDRMFFAGNFAPACSQPVHHLMPNLAAVTQQDEDCLFLNVWTTEKAMNYRNAPVVVFLEGEGFVSGSPNRVPGQDLAAEGVVVVSVGYRMNVFGFFCLEDAEARGNLGLLDQYLALLWIRENIASFGGDPRSVTMMGHSAGAASVMFHMVSPRTAGLFHRAIIMSGSVTSPWAVSRHPGNASRAIARSLGCYTSIDPKLILMCLRNKSTSEILRAYETQYMNGNWTTLALPVVDSFLPDIEQYLPRDPVDALKAGIFLKVPILSGITSHEGAIAVSQWSDLITQGYSQLRQFFKNAVIPSVIHRYGFSNHPSIPEISSLLEWQYIDNARYGDTIALLSQLIEFYSDAQFKAPHAKQLNLLSQPSEPANLVYAYQFEQTGLDVYGKNLNVTGAAHGTELLFLFGPTLMQQVVGRRFTPAEDRLSIAIKRLWSEFIRQGNISPSPFGYGITWRRYTPEEGNYVVLKTDNNQPPQQPVLWLPTTDFVSRFRVSLWNDLLPKMLNITEPLVKTTRNNVTGLHLTNDQPYRNAMYTLIAFVIVLLILLIVCVVLLKRRAKERERDLF